MEFYNNYDADGENTCALETEEDDTAVKEMILYYTPGDKAHTPLLRGVAAQMGVKVKNLTPERCIQRIGYLLRMEGIERREVSANFQKYAPVMDEEMLVLAGFTEERLEELLENLKKAGVPKINLKAIVTETNAQWTAYQLYEQLKEEHTQMNGR